MAHPPLLNLGNLKLIRQPLKSRDREYSVLLGIKAFENRCTAGGVCTLKIESVQFVESSRKKI